MNYCNCVHAHILYSWSCVFFILKQLELRVLVCPLCKARFSVTVLHLMDGGVSGNITRPTKYFNVQLVFLD